MKLPLPREEKDKIEKIDIVIVETDNEMFEREKIDIKRFSPFVNRIYRCTYHRDVFQDNLCFNVKLIIANNPDNAGIDFFYHFYSNPQIIKNEIYGILYTHSYENEYQFYRKSNYLWEISKHLFLGYIYKRYGSLEKILEVIANIAHNRQFYPMFDWIYEDAKKTFLDVNKIGLYRRIHNIKHNIFSLLKPLLITLNQFHDDKNIIQLKENLDNNRIYFNNFSLQYENLIKNIKKLIKIELGNKDLDFSQSKTEMTYYLSQLVNFVKNEGIINNNLIDYLDIFNNHKTRVDEVISRLIERNNNGSLEAFLLGYKVFIKSLNKLIDILDEHYFLK